MTQNAFNRKNVTVYRINNDYFISIFNYKLALGTINIIFSRILVSKLNKD